MGFGEVVVATGKLRSFLSMRDCSRHIPSRGTIRRIGERLCLVVADADLSVANSSPYSHSNHGNVRPAKTVASRSPHPRSRLELARTGGISSDSRVARIEQPRRIVFVASPVFGFTILVEVGFVVLSSVGAHPRAKRMAPTDDRTTKPDHLYLVSPLDM